MELAVEKRVILAVRRASTQPLTVGYYTVESPLIIYVDPCKRWSGLPC
jgi:hypothetical protein